MAHNRVVGVQVGRHCPSLMANQLVRFPIETVVVYFWPNATDNKERERKRERVVWRSKRVVGQFGGGSR